MLRPWHILPMLAWLGVASGCRSPLGWHQPSSGLASATSVSSMNLDPLASLDRRLVFYPTRYPAGNWRPSGLSFEEAWFSADDGTRLHGWYVPHERPRAVVLYCHGNGGNLSDCSDVLRVLHDRVGVAVMIFDYRGYGEVREVPTRPEFWPTLGRPALGLLSERV